MPPDPKADRISYGPSLVPAASVIVDSPGEPENAAFPLSSVGPRSGPLRVRVRASSRPRGSLEVFHQPDVAALRTEPVEQKLFPVRRPDRVVDSRIGVVEREHLVWLAAPVERRDPDRFVADD